MNIETKFALEASIRHWEDNVANWQGFVTRLLAGEITRYDLPIFKDQCALCGVFYAYNCQSCPLDEAGHCCNEDESPWTNMIRSLSFLRIDDPNSIDASHNAAHNMLQTLKDLNHD